MKPEQPDNEPQRLAYLRALNILDTEREQRFDDIAYLAMSLCGTPIAVVSRGGRLHAILLFAPTLYCIPMSF
jgi:hypothetical protein